MIPEVKYLARLPYDSTRHDGRIRRTNLVHIENVITNSSVVLGRPRKRIELRFIGLRIPGFYLTKKKVIVTLFVEDILEGLINQSPKEVGANSRHIS